MKIVNDIVEMNEIIMFGAGCLDVYNCSEELTSEAQLAAVEGYCKGGGNSGGPYYECGVKKTCK